MTIQDLINMEIDIDVYDDVCEDLAIAFCGPQPLTEEGKKHFADIMGYEVDINPCSYGDMAAAIVKVDGPEWEKKLEKAKEFFDAAAGYCPCEEYDKWFGKEGDGN